MGICFHPWRRYKASKRISALNSLFVSTQIIQKTARGHSQSDGLWLCLILEFDLSRCLKNKGTKDRSIEYFDSFHTKFPFCKQSKNSENSSWKFKLRQVIVVPNLGISFGEILIDDVKLYKMEKYGKMFPSKRRYKSQ